MYIEYSKFNYKYNDKQKLKLLLEWAAATNSSGAVERRREKAKGRLVE